MRMAHRTATDRLPNAPRPPGADAALRAVGLTVPGASWSVGSVWKRFMMVQHAYLRHVAASAAPHPASDD